MGSRGCFRRSDELFLVAERHGRAGPGLVWGLRLLDEQELEGHELQQPPQVSLLRGRGVAGPQRQGLQHGLE